MTVVVGVGLLGPTPRAVVDVVALVGVALLRYGFAHDIMIEVAQRRGPAALACRDDE